MLDVLVEKTDLDELDFGMIRSSFAGALFAAIFSQRTRVWHPLFVPWMFCAIAVGRDLAARASRDPRTVKGS